MKDFIVKTKKKSKDFTKLNSRDDKSTNTKIIFFHF